MIGSCSRRGPAMVLAVALLGLATAGGAAAAPGAACQAWDETSGAGPTDLASALATAAAGDTIGISGTCFGPFTLARDVTLTTHRRHDVVTLDGGGTSSVVQLAPGVHATIDSLTLTHAGGSGNSALVVPRKARAILSGFTEITQNTITGDGAAAWVSQGKLTVSEQAEITDNHVLGAGSGGAVFVNHGSLVIDKAVKITGNTAADGRGGGVFLNGGAGLISGHVTISDNGAHNGAGIYISGAAAVTVKGSVRVISNVGEPAGTGGGIEIDGDKAALTVKGRARVNGNTADAGGGISNRGGQVTISGTAQVNINSAFDDLARGGGGILTSGGRVRLAGSAQVDGNSSPAVGGGIILYETSRVVLQDEAQVIGNTAGSSGGGILADFAAKVIACSSWAGAISPNTPDDPPPLLVHSC